MERQQIRQNEGKLIKLLIVEDTPEQIDRVKAMMQSHAEEAIADYAINLREAKAYLSHNQYAGVLSDMFFPSGECEEVDMSLRKNLARRIELITPMGNDYFRGLAVNNPIALEKYETIRKEDPELARKHIEKVKAFNNWKKGETLAPMGTLLADIVSEANIPMYVVTDAGHHSAMLEPINEARSSSLKKPRGSKFAGFYFGFGSTEKDWEKGYRCLIGEILNPVFFI